MSLFLNLVFGGRVHRRLERGWLNLQTEPHAKILVDGQGLPMIACELEEPERGALFDRFVAETDESYLEYQQRTTRRLPVVALTPKK